MSTSAPVDQLCSGSVDTFSPQTRSAVPYDPLPDVSSRLRLKPGQSYRKQYASQYFVRLTKLRPQVLRVAEKQWSGLADQPEHVSKVPDVTPKRCYVVGTIYVSMALKPNVLQDISEEVSLVAPAMPLKYKSDQDTIAIEDESGRIELSGSILANEFWVTGMVVGLLGCETALGTFEVEDVCFPGMPAQITPAVKHKDDGPRYVALVSGLNVGETETSDLKTQLLREFLTGELGSLTDQQNSSTICRLIIAGNSLTKRKLDQVEDTKKKKYGYDSTKYDVRPAHDLDDMLEDIGSTMPIDIMSGERDPVKRQWPQQPINKALFDRTRNLSTVKGVTNPHWCKVGDITFLGTSGQNLDDIYRYVDGDDRLQMAERCLHWRHIAPSAPDTLWCYPFQDDDPFLLEECPHVYFIGNQPRFEQRLAEGPDGQKVRVVLVPSFSETGCLALVDLVTLECTSVQVK
ncbi:DNA polymerase alpha/epsilon subunit B-domain-containing protein [Syncephalastrum racemosum]|uniref:DNA-directed DNA polymerase n=1 Tax=Syncephalastrum racemosum TaxID=13706 RepID=A0A1X2GZQ5_SYNRA|nr:DNA polymerase alpha/epsilon subunit B-domain-containing protein [Syncephalastrum racemosum]